MQTTEAGTYNCSARTGAVNVKGGHSLAARAVQALLIGDYRFEREFGMAEGGEVWGVYKGAERQPSYAVETAAGVIARCNCPDAACRRRVCKHSVLLSVVGGYALRVGGSVLRFASALLTSPSAIADAVTERADMVKAAQRAEAAGREQEAHPHGL